MRPHTALTGVKKDDDGWELTFSVRIPHRGSDIKYPEEVRELEFIRKLKGIDINDTISPTENVRTTREVQPVEGSPRRSL